VNVDVHLPEHAIMPPLVARLDCCNLVSQRGRFTARPSSASARRPLALAIAGAFALAALVHAADEAAPAESARQDATRRYDFKLSLELPLDEKPAFVPRTP
jgi:hypothetical protein